VVFTREPPRKPSDDERPLEGTTLERALPAVAGSRRGGLPRALFAGYLRRAERRWQHV
jgi:hypothetical protein